MWFAKGWYYNLLLIIFYPSKAYYNYYFYMLRQKGWLIIDKCQNELNNDNFIYISRMLAKRESYNGVMQESQVISTPFRHLSVIYWIFWFVCPQLKTGKLRWFEIQVKTPLKWLNKMYTKLNCWNQSMIIKADLIHEIHRYRLHHFSLYMLRFMIVLIGRGLYALSASGHRPLSNVTSPGRLDYIEFSIGS